MIRSILLIFILLLGCGGQAQTKTEREGEPAIYSVTDEDAQMNAAMQKAKETLPKFTEALLDNRPETRNFALKKAFATIDGGKEHIWISNISWQGTQFMGIVGNVPNKIPSLALGDSVSIESDEVSDWMYLENDVLAGGYTIRLLYQRMSPAEREHFSKETSIVIGPE